MSAADVNAVLVRPAVVSDAAPIMKIYGHYVKNTIFTFEETPPKSEYFADKINNTGDENPLLTATYNGVVCGYAYADLWRTRCAYRNTLESSLYVDCAHVGLGVGKALLDELLECLRKTPTRAVVAVISLPNPAVSLCMRSAALSPAACYTESGGNSARLVMSGFGWRTLSNYGRYCNATYRQ